MVLWKSRCILVTTGVTFLSNASFYSIMQAGSLSLCVGSFYTKAAGEVLEWPADQILLQEVRETPMPDTGDSRIGKILNRFYKKGLGGRDNWESIISMCMVRSHSIGIGR